MTTGKAHPNYVTIWIWLVALVAVSLTASLLPGGRVVAVTAIFLAAVVKAGLVARNYMHLRFEPRLIYAIALVPVLFAVILAFALFPDFVLRR
ncbi:MAG: cytochrome C oxidase subunit IV family protein [Candidatus Rokubacteria bacterium]|nr:cytochrome C oxidase subunit IV family protein [Candidatus Rokubacteria bacterium]